MRNNPADLQDCPATAGDFVLRSVGKTLLCTLSLLAPYLDSVVYCLSNSSEPHCVA